MYAVADPRGTPGTPHLVPFFPIFMQFSATIWKNASSAHSLSQQFMYAVADLRGSDWSIFSIFMQFSAKNMQNDRS